MSETIQILKQDHSKFGSVRTILIEGEVWFFATDVAEALSYKNPHAAILKYCKDAKNLNDIGFVSKPRDSRGLEIIDENGNPFSHPGRSIKIISESDVYELILRARTNRAKLFQRWVTKEVLPSIRKNGYYSVKPMSQLEILQQSVNVLVEHEKRLKEVEQRVTKIEDERQEACNEVANLDLSEGDPPKLTKRKELGRFVNAYSMAMNMPFNYGWNQLYLEYRDRHSINLRARATKRNKKLRTEADKNGEVFRKIDECKALDIAEELGVIDDLFVIISRMIKDSDLNVTVRDSNGQEI